MKKGFTKNSVKKAIAILLAGIIIATIVPIALMFAFATDSEITEDINQIITGRRQSDGDKQPGGKAEPNYYDDHGQTGVNEDNFTVAVEKSITDLDSTTGERLPENCFEITLKAETTVNVDTIEVFPDAAVVLVIDVSGSMNSTTKFQTVEEYPNPKNPLTGEFLPESTDYSGYYVYNNNLFGNYNGLWTQRNRNGSELYSWSTTVLLNIPNTLTRLQSAKKAANEFLDSFVADAGDATRMVSVVTFNGIGSTAEGPDKYRGYSNVELSWTNVTDNGNLAEAKDIINGLTASLGTFTQGGLMLARNLYLPANAPVNAENNIIDNRYVILLTDGNPTHVLGSTTGDGTSGNPYIITNDTSVTSLDTLEGNLLYGSEIETVDGYFASVSAARNAAETVAGQIKSGGINGSYSARLYTIGFGISSVGFANSYGGAGSYTGDQWLQSNIASATTMHYIANDISGLQIAFEKIAKNITKIANAWIVTDPMAPYISFNSDNAVSDSTNSAAFSDNTLLWNIKDSKPVNEHSRGANTTVYTYELKYRVTLDNLSGYEALSEINTNGVTTLTYVVDNRKADEYDEKDFVTVEFTVPVICGYDAPFTFTKTDDSGNILKQAFGFTLRHDADCKCHLAGAIVLRERTVNSETGEVDFGYLPSGHEYVLTESFNPEPTLYETADPSSVKVSYGVIEADAITGGQFVNKASDVKVTLQKFFDNADGSFFGSENELVCGIPEHTHSDSNGCYNRDQECVNKGNDETVPVYSDSEQEFDYTTNQHECDDTCFLTCGLVEHSHESACYVNDSQGTYTFTFNINATAAGCEWSGDEVTLTLSKQDIIDLIISGAPNTDKYFTIPGEYVNCGPFVVTETTAELGWIASGPVEVNIDASNPNTVIFNNEYGSERRPSFVIDKKLVLNSGFIKSVFSFDLYEGGTLIDTISVDSSNGYKALVRLPDRFINADVTLILKEVQGNTPGMTYDESEYTMIFENGILVGKYRNGDTVNVDGIVNFINTYAAPARVKTIDIQQTEELSAETTRTEELSAETAKTGTSSEVTSNTRRSTASTATGNVNTEVIDVNPPLAPAANTEIEETAVPTDAIAMGDAKANRSVEAAAGIVDASVPQSAMPQTGVNDSIQLWIFCLCASILGLGTMFCVIKKAKR